MKHHKISLDFDKAFNFQLIGISCVEKGYKVVWWLNSVLGIDLRKEDDIEVIGISNKKIIISNYLFETEHTKFQFFNNKESNISHSVVEYLIPELNSFDYLLKITDSTGEYQLNDIRDKIMNVSIIQYAMLFDVRRLKNKENLLF